MGNVITSNRRLHSPLIEDPLDVPSTFESKMGMEKGHPYNSVKDPLASKTFTAKAEESPLKDKYRLLPPKSETSGKVKNTGDKYQLLLPNKAKLGVSSRSLVSGKRQTV